MIIVANLAFLVAWILYVCGSFLASGIVLLLVGIWVVRYRWIETHDALYTVGSGIVLVFILLYVTWWGPQEILPIGWLFPALVGWIALLLHKETK